MVTSHTEECETIPRPNESNLVKWLRIASNTASNTARSEQPRKRSEVWKVLHDNKTD